MVQFSQVPLMWCISAKQCMQQAAVVALKVSTDVRCCLQLGVCWYQPTLLAALHVQLITYSLQDAVVLSSKRCSDQLAIRLNIDILQMPHKPRMLSHMQHPGTATSSAGTEGSRLAGRVICSVLCGGIPEVSDALLC